MLNSKAADVVQSLLEQLE
ncbi:hypothetical protein A2U01_0077552, partial [Trifolium medium]|nr:hypothetical protein [Trifolium medium]